MIIKRGSQSLAVRVSKRRILKLPNTAARTKKIWHKWHAHHGMTVEEIKRNAAKSLADRKRTIDYIKKLCKQYPQFRHYFGNPRFVTKAIFFQEYTSVLGAIILRQNKRDNSSLFEAYAQAILTEWQYGFSDTVFDLTENTGLDRQGRLVLFDFGEVSLDRREVEDVVRQKKWLSSWSFGHDIPASLRSTYASILAKHLTPANLKRYWGVALRIK
jgi:hypothetical protein